MEDHHPLFFPSDETFDNMSHCYDISTIIESYDHGFDDLMLFDGVLPTNVFDAKYEIASNLHLPLDTVSQGIDEGLEDDQDEGNSFGTTTGMAKPRRDRSKTLVSERRRRGRMKEKLYELRSMVPNITKMDKASIIEDAVVYARSLQNQAKNLMEEVASLESSSKRDQVSRSAVPLKSMKAKQAEEHCSSLKGKKKKILGVIAHEVGAGKFYVEVECNKGDGVASSLYSAIELLGKFKIENSSLSTTSDDNFTLTITMNVRGCEEPMSASSMKLWVMGALLRVGFAFETTRSASQEKENFVKLSTVGGYRSGEVDGYSRMSLSHVVS